MTTFYRRQRMTREVDIESHLVRVVEQAGGLAIKFTSPGRANVPDRIVVLPGGRVVFVEVKRPGEKPTAGQVREHDRLRLLGCDVRVVDHFVEVGEL